MNGRPTYAPTWFSDDTGDSVWVVYNGAEGFQPAYAIVRADDAGDAADVAEEISAGRLAVDAEQLVVIELESTFDIDDVLRAYVECAIWADSDLHEQSPGGAETIDDVAPESLDASREDIADFLEGNAATLAGSGLSAQDVGHDFWLTRNGHGTGFWDRGLGRVGDRLAAAAGVYGEVWLYVDDDGQVWFT